MDFNSLRGGAGRSDCGICDLGDDNPGKAEGLVLWAAYPLASSSLRDSRLAVVSVYGSLDGVATPDEVLAAKEILPSTIRWVEIRGGNHAQFRWYGPQSCDGTAAISREEQQAEAVKATVKLLRPLKYDGAGELRFS